MDMQGNIVEARLRVDGEIQKAHPHIRSSKSSTGFYDHLERCSSQFKRLRKADVAAGCVVDKSYSLGSFGQAVSWCSSYESIKLLQSRRDASL